MRFMLLQHYAPAENCGVPMHEWSPGDIQAHIAFQQARLTGRTIRIQPREPHAGGLIEMVGAPSSSTLSVPSPRRARPKRSSAANPKSSPSGYIYS